MKSAFLIFATTLALMQGANVMGENLHVSLTGDDRNPGTESSPFRTLEAARDALRARNTASGVTIWIHGGVYERRRTFTLDARDSGTPDAPVVYRADPRARVRMTGGMIVPEEAIARVTDPTVLGRVSADIRDRLVRVDLAALGIENPGQFKPRGFGLPQQPAPMEVFFNKQRLEIARWPNDGWAVMASFPEDTVNLIGSGGKVRGKDTDRFFFDGDRMERWRDTGDLWVYGYWMYDWADAYIKVREIDLQTRLVVLEPPQSRFGYKKDQRFRFLNLLEELDIPGEYFIDRDADMLYFLPPGQLDNAEVTVSVLDVPLVAMDNVSHVEFMNIGLECARASGIVIEGGVGVRIAGCEIHDLGQSAVTVSGGENHEVVSCDIYNLGEAGITMSGGDRTTLVSGRHSAVNNHIHHFGFWVRTYQQGVRVSGVGNHVAHNYIHHAPHTAIAYNGNDHVIEYNHIHDVALDTGDVGVIYTGRDWSARGNVVQYNYIHDTGSRMSHGTMAIYLDDLTSGTSIYGNVLVRAGKGVFIGGGRDTHVENNIFIDGEYGVHIDNRGKGWSGELIKGRQGSWDMFGKLERVPYDQPLYTDRYPELIDFLEKDPLEAMNNTIVRNIKIGEGLFLHLMDVDEKNVNLDDNLVDTDPQFAGSNPLRADFQLSPGSPALKLGFKQIPFGMIGLQRDRYRTELPEE